MNAQDLFASIKILSNRILIITKKFLFPIQWKETHELGYWKNVRSREGVLHNNHYAYFYTAHFGIEPSFYHGKNLLDIGCGPRGSLEWATMAARRIGLDPLAKEYLELGAKHHQMEYCDAPSEKIPLKSGEWDAVFSFNSLDHVQNIHQTIKEIKRITRPNGIFLLLVEVNHHPTDCEPHQLTPDGIVSSFEPEFTCESLKVYKPMSYGMYNSIHANEQFTNPLHTREVGYLSAKFCRVEA